METIEYREVKLKVVKINKLLVIADFSFLNQFNLSSLSKSIDLIILNNPSVEIELTLKSDMQDFKETIKMLEEKNFHESYSKKVYLKKLEPGSQTNQLHFKTIKKVGKEMFFSIFSKCIMSTEDLDLQEDKNDLKQSFQNLRNININEWNFLAYNGKEVIGVLILNEYKNYFSINYLGILPEFRNKGYAKYLMQKSEEEFYKKNKDKKWLGSTAENNQAMQRIFKKYGFSSIRTLHKFIKKA
ncbi:MAG: GNAT family N-acetyltransferase [archaeon]